MSQKMICFLRHAEPSCEEGSLTAKGRKQAASLDLPRFDETYSSPALRSQETAKIVNKQDPVIIIPELYYQVFELSYSVVDSISKIIKASSASTILIVSHAGVSNKMAEAFFPQHVSYFQRSLKHAEGFLCSEETCLFVTPSS